MAGNVLPALIVFDCFGVLYTDAFKAFLLRHEHRLPHPLAYYEQLDDQNGKGALGDEAFYAALAEGSGETAAAVAEQLNDTWCRVAGTVDIIRELRAAGKQTALLSNASRASLQHFLDHQDTAALFDVSLASSEVGVLKPHPGIFAALAERVDVPNYANWLFIDDSGTNIAGAEALGIPSHLFTTPRELRQFLGL